MTTLRAYLQLMRLPALFTAMADVFLGFLLTHRILQPVDGFVKLLIASSCLYLAGMVFNDIFDRKIDAEERPFRPIPSGRVPLKSAIILGCLLVITGLVAATMAGTQSLLVALVLALFVFLYDGLLKGTFAGPVAMGCCRSLNVLLGASFVVPGGIFAMDLTWGALRLPPVLARPQLPAAIALGIYVVGVTWFARQEARRSSRLQLGGATTVINLGLGTLAVLITGLPGVLLPWPGLVDDPRGVLFALLVIALILNRRLIVAIVNPVPERVQPAVKTLLLSIIFLDAILIFFHTNSPGYATMTAALILPALILGRWVFVT